MFLPSKNTEIFVFGFSLRIVYLITLDLAKNDNAVETVLSPTVLDETPLPIWLLLGLMLEELPTFALSTDEFAAREDTSPKELIEVKLEDVPTQLTTN